MTDETTRPATVLVTGGTGYLAAWVIAGLLRRGYRVRTTVRRPGKADQVRAAVGEQAGPEGVAGIEFAVADLLADDGWDEAVKGAGYVLHIASPLGTVPGQDPVRTAREGVRRVLGAAGRAGVRRAVFTSSGVTVIPPSPDHVADETVWATPSDRPADAYNASKILAERDAWELAAASGLELAAVLPTFIQGPVLGQPGQAGSVEVVRRLLDGGLPAIPNIGWNIVDVRDLAELHILAMTAPEAAGQRLLGAGRFLWWRDVARILRDELPDHAQRVPARSMPDLMVKLLARANPQMAMIRPSLHRQVRIDGTKTRALLGWQSRPAEQTILDTARSLIAKGAADA
jgi:dihydroflavonol-4-reductase